MLDKLTILVSTLLALSVAVERVIEILKGLLRTWPFVPSKDADANSEQLRCAVLYILSMLVGCVIAAFGHIAIIGTWNGSDALSNAGNVAVAGLLSSGGSAFWNQILDLLKAIKVKKEVEANLSLRSADLKNGTVPIA
jgi:hypothetical protein